MDNNNNPMTCTSASCTQSVFFSTPTEVLEIMWASINASTSLCLTDMDDNILFKTIADPGTVRVIEDPRVFANGMKFSTSTGIDGGKLYVWVR